MEVVIRNPGVTNFWACFELEVHRTEYARWWYWAAIDRPSCWSICLIFFAYNADISLVWLREKTLWKAYGWGEISTCLASAGTTVATFRGGGLIKQKNSNTSKKQNTNKSWVEDPMNKWNLKTCQNKTAVFSNLFFEWIWRLENSSRRVLGNFTKKNPHQSLKLMRVLIGGQNPPN